MFSSTQKRALIFASSFWLLFLAIFSPAKAMSPKIVHGQPAVFSKRDAIGSIYFNRSAPANEGHFCAGTLISPRYVITAAHCLRYIVPKVTDIVFGRDDLRFREGTKRAVVRKYTYPGYKKKSNFYDVGLIYLNAPVYNIRPLKIFPESPSPGKRLDVLGWGQVSFDGLPSPQLLQTSVVIKSKRTCLKSNKGTRPDESFCAGTNLGNDACFGDSGGPAVDFEGSIVGIISRGAGCGMPKHPGVYSRLDKVLPWIYQVIKNNPAGSFRRPAKEQKYNSFSDSPYLSLGSADKYGWRSFNFDIYSWDDISSAEVIFPENISFCSERNCSSQTWQMQDLNDPYQFIFSLAGVVKGPRCFSIDWRVTFKDHRLQVKNGTYRVCDQS